MLISFFYQVKQWLYLRLINPANIIALVMNKIHFHRHVKPADKQCTAGFLSDESISSTTRRWKCVSTACSIGWLVAVPADAASRNQTSIHLPNVLNKTINQCHKLYKTIIILIQLLYAGGLYIDSQSHKKEKLWFMCQVLSLELKNFDFWVR